MALHPKFTKNQWLYLYLTAKQGNTLVNRVERYRFGNDQLTEKTNIIEGIPGANYHDGGRIAFGPDGFLYVSTSNTDGRGEPQPGDDKILKINLAALKK